MNTILMNSKSKTSDAYRLVVNPADKMDFKGAINMLHYQILASPIQEKIQKNQIKIMYLTYQHKTE